MFYQSENNNFTVIPVQPIKLSKYIVKCLLIGSCGVGKSSILSRYTLDIFNNYFITTIGVDFKFKNIQMDNNDITLQIWDTASQERFRCITKNYYKNCNIIIVCYDITNANSFTELDYWITEANSSIDQNSPIQIVICGTKLDLEKNRVISKSEAQNYANFKNLPYFEISSKNNQGIDLMFDFCISKLLTNDKFISLSDTKNSNSNDSSVNVNETSTIKFKINYYPETQYKNTCCYLY